MDTHELSSDEDERQSSPEIGPIDKLAEAEALLLQLQLENAEQKAQIERLQRDRMRKSMLPQTKTLLKDIPEEPEGLVGNIEDSKVEQFMKIFNSKNVSASQLSIHAINSIISLHQMMYSIEGNGEQNMKPFSDCLENTSVKAAKIAFNYVLEFVRQLNTNKLTRQSDCADLSYPISWLLSLFPYISSGESGAVADTVWMPLHFSLALDSSSVRFEIDSYLDDVSFLMEEYGAAAFDEDVSPLSIAVSLARPNLEVVRLIVEYRPDSVSKTDEDGSLPLMHACANNVDLSVIEYLYECYPAALKATDSFGCAAIHYAAFYGCVETVKYLINLDPSCANMVEGNGALPIHDAVQNTRSCGGSTEMVEFLLQVNPSAVRKRDDYGAFPLHKAAKSSHLAIVKLVHAAFPKVSSTK
jgi:hypothetical protein